MITEIEQLDDIQVAIIINDMPANENIPISRQIKIKPVVLKKITNQDYVRPIFKVVCIVFLFGVFCYFCFIIINRFVF